MIITRRAFTAALSWTGLAAVFGFSPLRLIGEVMAQNAADVAKPVSLPDMALGPADAKVTITEYASMTCPHCAAFNADVFPKIKAEFIDTGKVRYIFREFPLDIKAAAGRPQPAAGRGMPEGPVAARQDCSRPEICIRGVEGGFDADFLHQRREDQGRDLARGIREADQPASEELIAVLEFRGEIESRILGDLAVKSHLPG